MQSSLSCLKRWLSLIFSKLSGLPIVSEMEKQLLVMNYSVLLKADKLKHKRSHELRQN